LKVEVINDQNKIKIEMDLMKKVSGYISNKFDKDPKSKLNIIFSDIRKIRELNKKYRKVDRETDVLSFSYINDKESVFPGVSEFTVTIGEIYICPEVASSNVSLCKKSNWNLNLEIILLIIHGMLHVHNYDHVEERGRMDMERIQDSLISDVRTNFNL
jgi:probable rRNA maturation factor